MSTSIEVDVQLDDLIGFYEYYNWKSPGSWKRGLFARFGIPLLWLVARIPTSNSGAWDTILPDLVMIAVWICLYPPIVRMLFRAGIQNAFVEGRYKQVLGRHSVSLLPDNLVEEGPSGKSTIRWDYVHRVERTKGLMFFSSGAKLAAIVPRRSFPTDEAFTEFFDEAVSLKARFIAPVGEDSGDHGRYNIELQSARKYRKYVQTRVVITLVVICALVIAFRAYWKSTFDTPQVEDQEHAIRSMQDAARLDLGMRFMIHSDMTKHIGGSLEWNVDVVFDSDSVAAFQDTLGVEHEILVIIGGLARYSPSGFVFIYKRRISALQSEESVHSYSTDEVRGFLGLPKFTSDSRSLLSQGSSAKSN